MREFSEHITADDKVRIFYRRFRTEKPVGTLVVVHGLGEHSGRYKEFAAHAMKENFEVFALDLRGHGRSEGGRGCVDRFDRFGFDLNGLLDFIPKWLTDLPVFVLGHSLGGLIVAYWALFQVGSVKPQGVILSAPALGLSVKVPPVKAFMGKVLSRMLPNLTMDNELDPKLLSRDEAEVKAYVSDPYVHRRISTRLFTEMMSAMARAQGAAGQWSHPLMMVLGESDRIVSVEAARNFFTNVGSADKRLTPFPDYRHEPFHEIGRDKAFGVVTDWVRSKIG